MIEDTERICRARTLLFVPAARPDRFDRALTSSADLVVVDLEASVRPIEKSNARAAALDWLSLCGARQRVLVRVNPFGSPWFADDVAALRQIRCAGMLLSMANVAADVAAAIAAVASKLAAVALIETAVGVLNAPDIALVPGVVRLAFGNMDYATDTQTRGRDSLIYPSSRLVLASRAAGLPPPIAGVTAAFRDANLLADEAAWERDQGFGGKFCIHPDQLEIAARAFAPTVEELAWARRVLAVARDSFACEVDGELVDRPVVERARRIAERADDPA
jgi:citrate lyase subunit beta / citryl-CoA lyase